MYLKGGWICNFSATYATPYIKPRGLFKETHRELALSHERAQPTRRDSSSIRSGAMHFGRVLSRVDGMIHSTELVRVARDRSLETALDFTARFDVSETVVDRVSNRFFVSPSFSHLNRLLSFFDPSKPNFFEFPRYSTDRSNPFSENLSFKRLGLIFI